MTACASTILFYSTISSLSGMPLGRGAFSLHCPTAMSLLHLVLASVTLIHAICYELTESLEMLFDTATLPSGSDGTEAQLSSPELTDNSGLGDFESQDFGELLQWINEETPSSDTPKTTVQSTESKQPVIDLTSDDPPIVPSTPLKSNEAPPECIQITSGTTSVPLTQKKRTLCPKLPSNESTSKRQRQNSTNTNISGNRLNKGIWQIAFQTILTDPAPYPYYSEATDHVQSAIALARQPKRFYPPLGDMITHNAGLWLFQHMQQMQKDQYSSPLNSGHLFHAQNMQFISSVGTAPRNTINLSTLPSDKVFAPRANLQSTQSHSSDQQSAENWPSSSSNLNIPTISTVGSNTPAGELNTGFAVPQSDSSLNQILAVGRRVHLRDWAGKMLAKPNGAVFVYETIIYIAETQKSVLLQTILECVQHHVSKITVYLARAFAKAVAKQNTANIQVLYDFITKNQAICGETVAMAGTFVAKTGDVSALLTFLSQLATMPVDIYAGVLYALATTYIDQRHYSMLLYLPRLIQDQSIRDALISDILLMAVPFDAAFDCSDLLGRIANIQIQNACEEAIACSFYFHGCSLIEKSLFSVLFQSEQAQRVLNAITKFLSVPRLDQKRLVDYCPTLTSSIESVYGLPYDICTMIANRNAPGVAQRLKKLQFSSALLAFRLVKFSVFCQSNSATAIILQHLIKQKTPYIFEIVLWVTRQAILTFQTSGSEKRNQSNSLDWIFDQVYHCTVKSLLKRAVTTLLVIAISDKSLEQAILAASAIYPQFRFSIATAISAHTIVHTSSECKTCADLSNLENQLGNRNSQA